MLQRTSKIYVAGHTGLVGSALLRLLWAEGFFNVITRNVTELDLRDQQAVHTFFAQEHIEYVFLTAARVGGIKANHEYPASFMYDNLMIQTNVIHGAYKYGIKKLLFLGSSCIYPRLCPQPIKEEYLLTGPLEATNEPYALAKIAGLKLCQAYNKQYGTRFIVAMPTNLYGPGDNFDTQTSHVLPALITKFIEAHENNLPSVPVWGTGNARREFLQVNDLAQALLILMKNYEKNEWINVGIGSDYSIAELAQVIKEIVGYRGTIVFDSTQPEGTPQKLLDSSKIFSLGWQPATSLRTGIEETILWYKKNKNNDRPHPSTSSG